MKNKRAGLTCLLITLTVLAALLLPVTSKIVLSDNQADAPLSLSPSAVGPVTSNQTFDLEIRTQLSLSQNVSGVQAYLTFDPGLLEVLQVTPALSLPTVLETSFNNTAGLISYSAGGALGGPFPSGNFTVAVLQFRSKLVTSNVTTPIAFSFAGTTTSLVDYGGTPIPGTHSNAVVHMAASTTVYFIVGLQGGNRPEAGWAVPLTLKFFAPGANLFSDAPLFSFNTTTTRSGNGAVAHLARINPAVYDISATSATTLTNVKGGVAIAGQTTNVNLGTLLEGDSNGNDIVNIQDFGVLAAAYGKSTGNDGFDARADFDRNGLVNIADFGLLAANYGKFGPILVP